jgi:hypothetical protein
MWKAKPTKTSEDTLCGLTDTFNKSTTQTLSCHDLNFKWKEVQRVVVRRCVSGKEMVKH